MNFFLKTIINLIALSFISSGAQASECRRLYDEGDYNKALAVCHKEARNFELGLIYGSRKNCSMMEKYYLEDGNASAIGNLGIHFLHGSGGCVKEIEKATKYLNEAIDMGTVHFADFLGNHYRDEGNEKLAKTYFSKVVNSEAHSDWAQTRIDNSFLQLKSLLNFEERIELFTSNNVNKQKKCELGRHLYTSNFEEVIEKFGSQTQQNKFAKSLCRGDKEFFFGLTFENGLGNKEDLREAFRFYLLAGAQGSSDAKKARDRIRDKLSPEQIASATCIADYGLEPNLFDRWRCGW